MYRCIRRDIESGIISAHEKLPSKRALAKHLGISLITVEGAFRQLGAEGYIYSKERKGYFASPLSITGTSKEQSITNNSVRFSDSDPEERGSRFNAPENTISLFTGNPSRKGVDKVNDSHTPLADFTGGSIPPGLFPYKIWGKTVREALANEGERSLLFESSVAGSYRLRKTLALHLSESRGMRIDPQQIVIGSGAQTLYNIIIQLLGRDRGFAVEDPGYPRLTKIYQSNEVSLAHIPMDSDGVSLKELRSNHVDIMHVMPSHQFPTGLVTPISRRYELLAWASEEKGRYIIEDDYDCEFRLAGKPISPMQTIDVDERVIYTNTFTKTLGPAFRIGYMVLPPHLASLFIEKLGFYSCTVSTIDQITLARFIESGNYERHVNRMRSYYRNVRNELIAALRNSPVGSRISFEAEDSGLHFILNIHSDIDDAFLTKSVYTQGIVLAPLSGFYQQKGVENTSSDIEQGVHKFVMSYGGISRESIPLAIDALAKAILGAENEELLPAMRILKR